MAIWTGYRLPLIAIKVTSCLKKHDILASQQTIKIISMGIAIGYLLHFHESLILKTEAIYKHSYTVT